MIIFELTRMKTEEKFLQDVLTSTLKGEIKWAGCSFKEEISQLYESVYAAIQGVNSNFKMFIVKMRQSENPYFFVALMDGKKVMYMTSGEMDNPYTLSALYLAAANPRESVENFIKHLKNY